MQIGGDDEDEDDATETETETEAETPRHTNGKTVSSTSATESTKNDKIPSTSAGIISHATDDTLHDSRNDAVALNGHIPDQKDDINTTESTIARVAAGNQQDTSDVGTHPLSNNENTGASTSTTSPPPKSRRPPEINIQATKAHNYEPKMEFLRAFQPVPPSPAPPQVSADFVMALADNSPAGLSVDSESKMARGASWADLTPRFDVAGPSTPGYHSSSGETINRPRSRSSILSGEAPLSGTSSSSNMVAAGTPTRTQQKLWLRKQGMDVVAQNHSQEKRECDRLAKEYAYSRRFGNPIADSLLRIKNNQRKAGLKPASRVSAPAYQYSLSATSMYCREESSEPIIGILNKMWNERTWKDPEDSTTAGNANESDPPIQQGSTTINQAAQQVQQQMMAAQRRQGFRIVQ